MVPHFTPTAADHPMDAALAGKRDVSIITKGKTSELIFERTKHGNVFIFIKNEGEKDTCVFITGYEMTSVMDFLNEGKAGQASISY